MEFSSLYRDMEGYIEGLQSRICEALEARDSAVFARDPWERPGGGGGLTRVLQDGSFVEKGGVNISSVHGELPDTISGHLGVEPDQFGACGLSLVIHPISPRIPSAHMNVRYFEMANGDAWFGGGVDLTPYYPHHEDFRHFHAVLRNACERVIPGSYAEYKRRCDEYFTIQHRNEMRGIGGIFFDYLRDEHETHFDLVRSVGDSFLESYLPIVDRRLPERYDDEDRAFQKVRRGRYVEFNLVYDRGTLFGLKTSGRVESILMSLPLHVEFPYDYAPEPGSPHAEMTGLYQPIAWLGEE